MATQVSDAAKKKAQALTRARRTAILKALADPNRFALLERVTRSACELGCSDLRSTVRIAPATLSHHLKELESAGLIQVRREGKFAYLSPCRGAIDDLLAALATLRPSCPANDPR
jgi:ArsR family transcriptional regulator